MLPMFSDELVNYAVNYLEDRGVEFKIAACNEKGFVVKINDQEQQLEVLAQRSGLLVFVVVN